MRGNLVLPFVLFGGSIPLAQSAARSRTFTPAGKHDHVTAGAHCCGPSPLGLFASSFDRDVDLVCRASIDCGSRKLDL
jgi:hypothetical protein